MIVFENKGAIDVRAIKTFGISAKKNENPIGYFGTGLKYAIAIILREGLTVELLSDGRRFEFTKGNIEMRGLPFEIIKMNEDELPFTTRLGQNWELWQAFRELYCNTLDEGGRVYETDLLPVAAEGMTYFIVKGRGFVDCFLARHEIVLNLPAEIRVGEGAVSIYNKPGKHLYYRGVRVLDLPQKSMMTYDLIADTDLTEDRTLKHPHHAEQAVARAICQLKNKSLIRQILTASADFYERDLNFLSLVYYTELMTEEFKEVIAREYKLNNDKLNHTIRDLQRRIMKSSASKHYEPEELTGVEEIQLNRAVKICTGVWSDFGDFKIMVVKSLGEETIALADEGEATMVISKKAFKFGTKYLVSTMIEEYMHLRTGHRDCSRELQTHLFDQICTLIEDHVLREPM